MDRALVYPGALPQTVDILNTNKFMMSALAYGMRAILGTNTYLDGCACLPTSPTPNLNVTVGVGSIYAQDPTDSSAYSDLGTDNITVYKQGILNVAQQLTITPPATVGFSQVYLVQAILQNQDAGAQVLGYFNASNPQAPFSGPSNAGTSNFTIRKVNCTIALKAGTPATTGTQTTPAPDAGYVGLYAITVANGATQITSGNIVQLATAPFISTKLPEIPAAVQSGKWLYAIDTAAGGAPMATTATTSTSSAVLTFASVPAWVTAGMKVANLTTVGSFTGGQTVLSKTATQVTVSANANATVASGDLIAFSGNAFVAAASPIPGALVPGMTIRVQFAGTNTGSATLNLNGLGAIAIKRANGVNVLAGDLYYNAVIDLVYDGAFWQISNYMGAGSGGGGSNTTNNVGIPYGTDSSAASNLITVSPTPAIGSLAAGQVMIVKLANPITGATTINVSGQSSSTLFSYTGQPLAYGAAAAGEQLWMCYDGTRWQLLNPPLPLQANLTIYVNPTTGSDAYDGSQATVSGTKGPMLTIQAAINRASFYTAVNGFTITIQLADGTYNAGGAVGPTPCCPIIINGNASNPSNVHINSPTTGLSVGGPNTLTVQNLKASAGGPPSTNAVFASGNGATLSTNNTVSGTAVTYGFLAISGGNISVGPHTFTSSVSYPFCAMRNGIINFGGGFNFTISTSIVVSYFALALGGGQMEVPSGSVPGWINPGNVSGGKFFASLNGVINVQGNGPNYFPGSSAGTVSMGGQYSN